ATDWIRAGRCRRVVVVAADDITTDTLLAWFGSGFLASGAAATDELVEDAALPFDRRRHGLLIGMGAAAAVIETADAARERGLTPLCEVLGTVTANSAFQGSRLDVSHICRVMEALVSEAESRWGIDRREIAPQTVFLSHETYTPARGGSAQAEVDALRAVFGPAAEQVVVANTKGYTGHPMAVGIEDVVAIKALETGLVPPVANVKEMDPDLGTLNLSRGGFYPLRYALRLGAGFGSQISMSLLRWTPPADGARRSPDELGYAYRVAEPAVWKGWLAKVSGDPAAEVEVVQRTLRVVDRGTARAAAKVVEKVVERVVEKVAEKAAPVVVEAVAPTRPSPPSPLSRPAPSPSPGEGEPVRDEVAETILSLVAEKTGYPREMLDFDLDMEADLGIDTVKQAETFAAIRAAYDIPRDENLKLRDYNTLARAIQFVYDRRPDLKAAPAQPSPPGPLSHPAPSPSLGEGETGIDAFPRRVPTPVLRPPIVLCKDTGVTLGPGSRVVVAFDQGGVGKSLAGRLVKMGVEVLPIEGAPTAAELEERLRGWRSQGPVQGIYWLTALDREEEISAMDLAAWREALRVRVKLLYTALRTLYDGFGAPGTFLISATRLGGRHGYDEAGAVAPLGGAVTGLTKSFQREKPGSLVKAVDFPASRQTAALAEALLEETLLDPGAVEIGREGDRRWTVGLAERPAGTGGMKLGKDTVFVVTGAAGSIVSAILQDLAAASGGTFHLLDLAPAPDEADPDLERFTADREGLKRDLFERIKARGERATPALVEKELARIERARAAVDALRAIRAAGGEAVYHRADLRDGAAVAAAIGKVRETKGRVDVLLHAAGLEISRLLPDKPAEEYDLVFDVKADGWFNLISAIGDMPLGAAVVFSSIAGRFGNGGQGDYSAANDLLSKSVSAFRRTRPGALGIALDWTAWGGIGMATRGSIPKVMEAAGIDMLPPGVGIPVVRRELTAGTRGEVVVAGRLGMMLEEFDATGGLDVSDGGPLAGLSRGVMVGKVTGMGIYTGLTVETVLDPAGQPFLDDHRIDGTPVLPGVMGIEAFAETAALLFPDLRVAAVEDVEFLAPFKFYRNEPRTLTLQALPFLAGEDVAVECRLTGSRALPGQAEPQVTTHFKARVRLASGPHKEAARRAPAAANGNAVGAKDIYRVYFHGPAYQVMEKAWRDGDAVAALLAAPLPSNHRPEGVPTVMEPRLIELCFQTAGISELGVRGRMALPLRVDRVSTVRHPSDGAPLFALAEALGDGAVEARVVDGEGNVYVSLSGYRTVELPGGVEPDRLAPLRAAMEGRPY
ncbi:MAG TPA: SDR family NAD(P)-dependent oxidoreductase, partial [Thermoanaerobaculia bacterium]|nr:SDR family NAD(P)-dependent oxidoreductase [Thermoanaerobaculia bacterium]